MGPAKKTTAAPPAEPAPKKRQKAEDKKKENEAVEVSDAAEETVSKLDNQKLLNFLKYRADPEKNKRGEQLHEAQQVLEARCFPSIYFPTISFPKFFFQQFILQTNWSSKNYSRKMQEPRLLEKKVLPTLTLFTLGNCAGLQNVEIQQEANLLAAVESQWFD